MRRVALFLFAFSFVLLAKPARFDFRDMGGRNLVQFNSEAPLEKIVAMTGSVSGWAEFDPEKLADGIRGELTVDTRTFITTVDSRNDQLRERLSAENPIAVYTVEKLISSSKKSLSDNDPVTLKVLGTLTLRGVTKPQSATIKVTYLKENDNTRKRLSGNLIKFTAQLDLDTNDFGLYSQPQPLFLARSVQVTADVFGTDVAPSPALGEVLKNPNEKREPSSVNSRSKN